MPEMSPIEEHVRFAGPRQTLSGVLAYPEQAAPEVAVLVCAPHPHFAGDMDNNVICAVARHLAARGVTLRFDYRGIGASEIRLPEGLSVFDYWEAVETARDYHDAVEDGRAALEALYRFAGHSLPLVCVGYSFGAVIGMQVGREDSRVPLMAAVAPPLGRVSFDFMAGCRKTTYWLVGRDDFLYDESALTALRTAVDPAGAIDVLDGLDHFFRGSEARVSENIAAFIHLHLNPVTEDSSHVT